MNNDAYTKYKNALSEYKAALQSGLSQDILQELEQMWRIAHHLYLRTKRHQLYSRSCQAA